MSKITKGQNTRRHIINQAAILFARNGYNDTRLSDILAATHLAKGGFYFHFKSKEELGEAVIDSLEEYWVNQLLPDMKRGQDATEKLEVLLSMPGDCLSTPDCLRPTVLLLNLATEMMEANDAFSQRLKQIFQNWLETIESIIEDGKAAAIFRSEIESRSVAGIILSTIMGANLLALLHDDPNIYQKHLSSLKTTLLGGIATNKQKEFRDETHTVKDQK